MSKAQEYLTKDIFSLQEIVQKLLKEKSELESDIHGLSQHEKAEKDRIQREFGDTGSIQVSIISAKKELASITEEIESKKIELKNVIDVHGTVVSLHVKSITDKNKELESIADDVNKCKKILDNLNFQKTNIETDVSNLLKRKTSLLNDIEKDTISLRALRNELVVVQKDGNTALQKKESLFEDIQRITTKKQVVVEDVLTDKNKRLFDRHQIQLGKSQALDAQILIKRKNLKTI